ncbi:MAG: hypothetical protein HOO96_24755 [Polyangiaceae bacterium]|nr:hypothetical protein [Polyangiaceae bacterium]
MLAQLMWEAGRPADALEILFQARRLNMDNAAAHLQYLGRTTFLARDRSPPEVAGLDVAVELIGEGAPGWMLTASAREADIGHNVYPMEHPVAKAVLGKRAGDEVVFGERFGPQWRVAALDSKYGFALRQSLGFFPARFPTQRGLERHRVREGDAEADFAAQLKERIEADEPHRTAVLREYGEGHLTVGGVATALGRPTLEAIGIVAACAAGLRGTTASPAEQQASTDVLRDRETVLVADVSACMMLDMLGVLRDGTLAHRRLAITQTTLDEFRAELMRWKAHSPDGFMSIGVHDGRLVRIETTADQVDQRRKNLESLVAWLQTKISIVALSASRVERLAPMADLAEFLGQSFWDSMLAASEPGHALLSDDLALRQLAAGEFATPGTCSPMLLQAEANDGTMGGDRYGECMVHLICAGYRHVSSDARVLRAAARMELWRPQGRVLRVLDTLKGPNVRSASAAMVAAAFFRLLWLDVVVPQQRETMCIAVLDAICTGRAARSVLPVFKAYLRRNFVLLPFASAAALQTVAAWERMRFI